MSTEQQQREEIEKILKEAQKKYGISSRFIYYKLEGEELNRFSPYSRKGRKRLTEVIFNPHLEYAVYIASLFYYDISESCIEFHVFADILDQFIPSDYVFDNLEMPLNADYYRDPLSQIFIYTYALLHNDLQSIYVCPTVFIVRPYNPDPASIFHGKYGIVTYCVTLANFIRMTLSTRAAKDIQQQFNKISSMAYKKLERLKEKDPQKLCNINVVIDVIHNEIEKADKLMQKYGIIRIAFPLS